MDNLRAIVKNLFCYIYPEDIMHNRVVYNDIDMNTFVKLGSGYIDRYTNDELENMFKLWREEFGWQNNRLRSEIPHWNRNYSITDKMNVFDALTAFNFNVLIEENGKPVCQYQHLLRWREMITALDEDLFTTSYLAMHDIIYGKTRHNFFWKPVIGHNNYALNRLVAKGVAENHFHMKGSAPTFSLSWISMMNNIANHKFAEILNKYDDNRLQRNINYSRLDSRDGFINMWRRAALIRLYLFSKLREYELSFDFMDNNDSHKVEHMINEPSVLEAHIKEIQDKINSMRKPVYNSQYDYTICEKWLGKNEDNGLNEVITGERWFLYSVFVNIYMHKPNWEKYSNLFYLYLIIKSNIRREIVQTNKNVGFDNFSLYQARKENFIDDTIYEDVYIRMAVKDTILNQHIISLEARVSPKDTPNAIKNAISKYDKAICAGCSVEEKERLLEKYFYVMHFVKEKEEYLDGECRHSAKRREVKKQAIAIADYKRYGMLGSDRVRGIDAASAEIGCRPEVFAQAFRYLKNSNGTGSTSPRYEDIVVQDDLMATYHVGEDFLDIVDGLRAIDEAVHFLNLRCGDRLGHALALGVDVDEWYEKKSRRIVLPKQDYLDNLVWLYARIRSYHIQDCDDAKAYIEKRFTEYFKDIYMSNISTRMLNQIEIKANQYIEKSGYIYNYDCLHFGINEYYNAWKLRGDNPELYQEGFFKASISKNDDWEYYSINRNYPLNYKVRYSPEASIIYYLYHYNKCVNMLGSQVVEVHVNDSIIHAVKKVQNAMQKEIANMGIPIETNPSSNYLIGTFRRYDRHPIVKWYNLGLVYDIDKLKRCPQIQVSINTDDQGVFYTYIENEYAYLALALEKAKDENGEPLYNRTFILKWLDNVRQMGIDQSFSPSVENTRRYFP